MLLLLLLHEPPEGEALNDIDDPVQTLPGPTILPGNGFTVATALALQPVDAALNTIVTVPVDTPVNIPPDPIVAMPVLLLLQVPLPLPALNIAELAGHTLSEPVIVGSAFTVTVAVVEQPVV